jgi:hypothetical protein
METRKERKKENGRVKGVGNKKLWKDYEEGEVGGNERHYGWGGTEYIIGFEGSQALPFVLLSFCPFNRYY